MSFADAAVLGSLSVIVIALAYVGIRLIIVGDRALYRVAHSPEALSRVLGGRYVAMAAMLGALIYLRDWQALMIALAAGVFMGIVDHLVEPKEHALPHLVVAIASLILMCCVYGALVI